MVFTSLYLQIYKKSPLEKLHVFVLTVTRVLEKKVMLAAYFKLLM